MNKIQSNFNFKELLSFSNFSLFKNIFKYHFLSSILTGLFIFLIPFFLQTFSMNLFFNYLFYGFVSCFLYEIFAAIVLFILFYIIKIFKDKITFVPKTCFKNSSKTFIKFFLLNFIPFIITLLLFCVLLSSVSHVSLYSVKNFFELFLISILVSKLNSLFSILIFKII